MRLYFFNSAVIANSKMDYWVRRVFESGFYSMAVFNQVKTVINVQIYKYLCT